MATDDLRRLAETWLADDPDPDVRAAENGLAAMKILSRFRPDLIVTDLAVFTVGSATTLAVSAPPGAYFVAAVADLTPAWADPSFLAALAGVMEQEHSRPATTRAKRTPKKTT